MQQPAKSRPRLMVRFPRVSSSRRTFSRLRRWRTTGLGLNSCTLMTKTPVSLARNASSPWLRSTSMASRRTRRSLMHQSRYMTGVRGEWRAIRQPPMNGDCLTREREVGKCGTKSWSISVRKFVLVAVVILLSASLGFAVGWFWRRAETVGVPLIMEDKQIDPIQHFLPKGWSIGRSKVQALDSIYLPFLHRKFDKHNVRVAQIEGSGVVFSAPKLSYTNTRLTKGTIITLADTGQLLRLEVHGDVPIGPLPGQMTLVKAEDYYQSVGTKYVDLPKDLPQLPFQVVLNRLYQHGSAEIEKAARIEAVYVTQVTEARPPAGATTNWIVNF